MRDSSLKDEKTSRVQAHQRQKTTKSLKHKCTFLSSNMEVDIEAQKNFTEKLPNILTAMIQVHPTAFVYQIIQVQDHM